MATSNRPPKQQRGTTLVEVLVASVILTLAFLFVSGDMIASTQAEKSSEQRGISISMANYLIDQMRSDGQFWSATSPGPGEFNGSAWTGAPLGPADPCGKAWPPYNDDPVAPTWHNFPVCAGSPYANDVGKGTYKYMWRAVQQTADPNAADLTVWISANTADGNGTAEIFEMNQLNRHDPSLNLVGVNPPSPSPTPTPKPSPSPTPTPSPTMKPSPTPTPSPTAKPSPTPTPSPTVKPSPTPAPSPTVIQ